MKIKLAGFMIAAASLIMAGCHSVEPVAHEGVQTARARVVECRLQQRPAVVAVNGSLRARETATLSAQVVGRVQQVMVHEGDNVSPGQTLAVLDDATLRASADQAEAAVKAAESQQSAARTNADLAASTLARYKQLQSQKSVSPQEMDEVTRRAEASAAQVDALHAQGNAARAQATGAQAMLAYTRIRAPFAGVITARMADPGTMAAPGVPLLQIDSAGTLQLQVTVDESLIGKVHKDQKLDVEITGATLPRAIGKVVEIVPAADPASHSFLVKIELPASRDLRAGMYGTAEIATGQKQALLVPHSAIIMRGSLPCAYVVDGRGIAQLRYLTLGASTADMFEVLSGLSNGERLVDDPADRDLVGKRIEAQP